MLLSLIISHDDILDNFEFGHAMLGKWSYTPQFPKTSLQK